MHSFTVNGMPCKGPRVADSFPTADARTHRVRLVGRGGHTEAHEGPRERDAGPRRLGVRTRSEQRSAVLDEVVSLAAHQACNVTVRAASSRPESTPESA